MAMATDVPQFVLPDATYVSTEAQKRLAMGDWAWKSFQRKSGLKTVRIGSRCYVRGADVIDAINRLAAGK